MPAATGRFRVEAGEWQEWQSDFQAHLQRYGHAIYNLDFSNPVAADDPAPLLETLKMFLDGQGTNPYERQGAASERREEATLSTLRRLKRLRLKLFRSIPGIRPALRAPARGWAGRGRFELSAAAANAP